MAFSKLRQAIPQPEGGKAEGRVAVCTAPILMESYFVRILRNKREASVGQDLDPRAGFFSQPPEQAGAF